MALASAYHKAKASPIQASDDVSTSSPVSWLVLASMLARLVLTLLCSTGKIDRICIQL